MPREPTKEAVNFLATTEEDVESSCDRLREEESTVAFLSETRVADVEILPKALRAASIFSLQY